MTGSDQKSLSVVVSQERNPFSGRPLNLPDSQEEQCFRAMVPAHGQNYSSGFYGNATAPISDHRTLYHNPAEVQQWAASSAAGENFPDFQCDAYQGDDFLNDLPMTSVAPPMPEVLPVSSSDIHQMPLFPSASFQQPNGSELNYNDPNFSGVGVTAFGVDTNDRDLQGRGFDYPMVYSSEQAHSGHAVPMGYRSDSSASIDNLAYADHMHMLPVAPGQGNDCLNIFSGWNGQGSNEFLAAEEMIATDALTWSTSPDVGPSMSPSYSHNSFLLQQSDTPLSTVMAQDMWSNSPMPVNGDHGINSPLSLGEAMNLPQSTNYVDNQSTLKPPPAFYRTPISSVDMWSQVQCDAASQANGSPPSSGFASSRRSSEGESLSARKDPLYRAQRGEDGLFHCPIPYSGGCKAEKLKCNYDKHLDSHLKPYRCRKPDCAQLEFSSTACSMRHEREAHGLHGHGFQPHLCIFPECSRSVVGNGFPRSWNCRDHMKRMHRYAAPEPSHSSTSPSASSSGSSHPAESKEPTRKRRSQDPLEAEVLRKAKSIGKACKPRPTSRGNAQKSSQQLWSEQNVLVEARYNLQ